ncbi:MAG TPA: BatD family protein, partial [Polyangiaceae bacterium]|nr:BatD family protein [Polyangiaceae bacterium]
MRALVSLLLALAALVVAFTALAAPKTRTTLQPDTIEVGDTATLTLVVSDSDVTSASLPALPNGLSVVGQGLSPAFQITIVNGQMQQVTSARAQFRIRATREGTFLLGAPSAMNGGQRLIGDRLTLKVVARGSLPQQQFNPFDPFGLLGQSPLGDPRQQQEYEPSYPVDPKFNLDHARDTGTFLHATVDKTQAVVGEQITLAVWVYADVTAQDPELSDPHEPGTSDFLRQSIMKDISTIERTAYAKVGGRTYAVALLRKYALFPLRAGELDITPMRIRTSRGSERQSEPIKVRVSEPPMDHRPAGYVVGDVGRYTVTADVTPREVERGAAISVTVDVTGIGNVPSSLVVPARPGVTWLEPEVKEDVHVLDEKTAGAPDLWGGSRHFSYVVEPKKEGDVDLGEITLSFYDPRTKAYDVARATLGVVHVKPGAAAPPQDDAKPFANMPVVRKQMEQARAAAAHLDDSNVFFGLLAMPSALFGIALGTRRAARAWKERAAERKTSPIAELK